MVDPCLVIPQTSTASLVLSSVELRHNSGSCLDGNDKVVYQQVPEVAVPVGCFSFF
jgi:hypothetical protein